MLPSLLSFKTCKRLKRTLILFKQYRKIIIMQVLNAGTFFMLQTIKPSFSSPSFSSPSFSSCFVGHAGTPFQATNKPSFSSPSFSSCFIGHAGTLFKQQTNHHFHHHHFHHHHFHLDSLAMQAPLFKQQTNHHFHLVLLARAGCGNQESVVYVCVVLLSNGFAVNRRF